MNVWKVILAALVIFGAGVITGGITVRLATVAPARNGFGGGAPVPILPQQRLEFARRLQRQLDLTPAQRTRVDQILHESQERMRALWEPIAPVAREESRLVRKQIREELTPAQKTTFDEVFKPHPGQKKEMLKRDSSTNNQGRTEVTTPVK